MKMDQGEIKSILDNEIDNSIGYIDTETTDQRAKALEYYLRYPYGNEVEGRSQIVTGEVAEAIDGALPQLIRVFTTTEDIVSFEPQTPDDEQSAKQATEYCNWVLMNDNPGFEVFQTWFKDALLQKNGIVKVWWNDETDVVKESYKDLTEEELALLLSDGQMEIVSQEQNQVGEVPTMVPDAMGMPVQTMQPIFSYNVRVKKVNKKGSVKVENVPPEEFLISKKARRIDEAPFVAHRKLTTRSELIAMGFKADDIDSLPAYDDLTFTPERVARYPNGEQPDDPSLDTSMDEIETFECYIRTDFDKDGTDVICEMEELDSFQIKITNPMMFAVRSSNLILQHWLPIDIMKGDAVAINTEDVLCVFKPTDEFMEYYLNTVDKMNAVLKNKSNVKEEEINMMEVLRDMESIKGNLLH